MDDRNNFDHYISKHYLKLFRDSSRVLHVGNVKTKEYSAHNDLSQVFGRPNWSLEQELENEFTKIEDKVAPALARASENPESIKGFANETLSQIIAFIALQYARSTGMQSSMDQVTEQFKQDIKNWSPLGETDPSLGQLRPSQRNESLGMGLRTAATLEFAITDRDCFVLSAHPKSKFITGDELPVRLTTQKEWYMKGGLPNKTTYLWFPLNPKLGLLFGYGLGSKLESGKVIMLTTSEVFNNTVNKAVVFVSEENIAGSSKGLIKGKLKLENIGEQRSKVERFGSSPIIFNINQVHYPINKEDITDLMTRNRS